MPIGKFTWCANIKEYNIGLVMAGIQHGFKFSCRKGMIGHPIRPSRKTGQQNRHKQADDQPFFQVQAHAPPFRINAM